MDIGMHDRGKKDSQKLGVCVFVCKRDINRIRERERESECVWMFEDVFVCMGEREKERKNEWNHF